MTKDARVWKIDNSLVIERDWPESAGNALQKKIFARRNNLLKRKEKYIWHLKMYYDIFNVQKGKKLLDVGCGNGIDLLEFSNWGIDATGIDITQDYCDMLNKLGSYFHLSLRADAGDACELPYDNETFDIVMAKSFFEHVYDFNKAISEQIRVLKKGGRLVIEDGNLFDLRTLIDLIFAYPFRSKGKYGGIKWIFGKSKIKKDLYGRKFMGKDEDIKSIFWWKQELVKYKDLCCIRKLTTTAEYTHPHFPKILRPFAGACLIIGEKYNIVA